MSERRGQRRIAIEVWVEELQGADRYFQRSANLSPGGIFLDNTVPHPKGTVVQLKFSLPGEAEPLQVRGEIVGEPDFSRLGMHVKFVDLDPGVAARIRAFVERASTASGAAEE